MTAAYIDGPAGSPAAPTLAVAAGRNLILAGTVFGAANLFQWGVLSGALHLHPAFLSLSWPVAVGLFLTLLFRLRRMGGANACRAASWSRWAVLTQICAALGLAGLSAATGDWDLMRWMSPIGLAFYAIAYSVAVIRGGPRWLAGVAIGATVAASGVAALLGTPEQYLAYAGGLVVFAFLPGLFLAFPRAR